MHSDLQKTFARVVAAELIEKGTPSHPRHLIIVKNFEWEGGQYGTEGILKEITIENRSTRNYKDIKLRLSDLGVSGPKVGPEGYTTNFVINDFIQAGSTKTFTNVNVGFRHPDATGTNIYVLNASPISKKEIRYRLGEGKKTKISKDYDSETYTQSSNPEEKSLSLAERYRKKLKEEDEKARAAAINTNEQNEDTAIETADNNTEPKIDSDKVTDRQEVAVTDSTSDYEIAEIDEREVPIPREDILIEDFKWGSGVPGSIGVIRELTLRNRSGITYTKIDLVVDFLSRQGVPLASNDFKLYEVLPPGETRTFENIKVGIIVVLPDEKNMTISIKNATDLN